MGLNSVINFFIADKWINRNNKNYIIFIAGTVFIDIVGIYFFGFLIPDCWGACLQGFSFWWC